MTATLFAYLFNAPALLDQIARNGTVGLLCVAAVVFLETGCVILPFLPGDSLLFATGAIISLGNTSLPVAMLVIGAAAILGDSANYVIGRSAVGKLLIRRGWIKPHHLEKGRAYFDTYGAFTIIVGRFVPIVRSVAPFLAGLTEMRARRFALYNAVGAIVWSSGLLLAGYWLGHIDWVRAHLSALSLGLVALSFVPVLAKLGAGLKPRASA